MHQLVDQPARQSLDTLALARFQSRHPTLMPFELVATQAFDTGTNVADRGDQIEPVQPTHERVRLALDDLLGLLRFALPLTHRASGDSTEIIDVVEINIFKAVDPRVEVAGHAKIDQKHRTVAALTDQRLALVRLEHRFAHGKRS